MNYIYFLSLCQEEIDPEASPALHHAPDGQGGYREVVFGGYAGENLVIKVFYIFDELCYLIYYYFVVYFE